MRCIIFILVSMGVSIIISPFEVKVGIEPYTVESFMMFIGIMMIAAGISLIYQKT